MIADETFDVRYPGSAEDRFIYIEKIPTLQEISSYVIALAIRSNDYYSRFYKNPGDPLFKRRIITRCNHRVETLNTPREIEEMIQNSVEKIEEEIRDWANYFDRVLFTRSGNSYQVNPIDTNWCVWLSNGQIDYPKTATKALESGKLSEVQKFIILCEYCMEEKIKNFSLDSLPNDYIENMANHSTEIQFYWICCLKNELYKIPIENYASVEVATARRFGHRSAFAAEYFWRRVTEEDQFAIINEFILSQRLYRFECCVAQRLISDLSWPHQHRLLSENSKIVSKFTKFDDSSEFALWVWKYRKDAMSDDQFAWFVVFSLERWMSYGSARSCRTFFEIWETAHDHQRNWVVKKHPERVTLAALCRYSFSSDFLFEFAIVFLQLVPVEFRRELILKKAITIGRKIRVKNRSLNFLNKVLDICLPNPDDKSRFKKLIVESEDLMSRCVDFLLRGKLKKINLLFEYFFGEDVETPLKFKKKLFELMTCDDKRVINLICNVEKWHEFEIYIDEIFSHDLSLALKKKQWVIESAIASDSFRSRFDFRRDFPKIAQIVEMLFKNDELKSIKGVFAHSFGESMKMSDYWKLEHECDGTYFQLITDWCLGKDEGRILKFKNVVSQDIIFDGVFYQINVRYQKSERKYTDLVVFLENLNKHLRWFLTCDDQVKFYKLNKLRTSFEHLEIFKIISDEKNDQFLEILLKWFFDGDDVEEQKFREENFEF